MLERYSLAAMKPRPTVLDHAGALLAAHPEGTLLGDLLLGTCVVADSFEIRCDLSPESVLIGLSSIDSFELTPPDAGDLLQANVSLVAGASSCWSTNRTTGSLMLVSSVDPGALLATGDAFDDWLIAISRCFVRSLGLLDNREISSGHRRADELAASALPIAEFRHALARRYGGEQVWVDAPIELPEWMRGLQGRWPGAECDGLRLRWSWENWTLEAVAHRWAKVSEVELRLFDERGSGRDEASLLDAVRGDGQLPQGASVVGSMLEGDRLVRIWRFPESSEPLKTADSLIEALQVYRM